jgi:hypothetical protein
MSPFQRIGLAGLGLPAALIALAAVPCGAQTVIPPDTTVAPRDTTVAATQDTSARPAPASGPAPAPAPAPPPVAAPTDEVLAAACAAGGGVADDLLLVVFRPGTTPAGQQAVARAAGGTLAGTNSEGAYYLKASGAAVGGVNALADLVIRQEAVATVGRAECPPTVSPPPAAPAESGAGR